MPGRKCRGFEPGKCNRFTFGSIPYCPKCQDRIRSKHEDERVLSVEEMELFGPGLSSALLAKRGLLHRRALNSDS